MKIHVKRIRKRIRKRTATAILALLISISAIPGPPGVVCASYEDRESVRKEWARIATTSGASLEEGGAGQEPETGDELEAAKEPETGDELEAVKELGTGDELEAVKELGTGKGLEEGNVTATGSNGRMRSMATGDLWTGWTGTMDFLSGTHGDGSRERPYQISTKAQLMGLSELAAMGMTVREGAGSYPGDYSDCCFRLIKNIDLGGMAWIPIGFYQNEAEMTGKIAHSFSGVFDGNGKVISNFHINEPRWRNVGFFGKLEGAEILDLRLEPSGSMTGLDDVGILAGCIQDSIVRNVEVHGDVRAGGTAGGIAGSADRSVIENCTADVTINTLRPSNEGDIYIGGITGKAAASALVDLVVRTGDNSTSRIQGQGYIGGITGFQNGTDIFRAEISGTIGGSGSLAAGGVSGLYHAGQMKVIQFSGKIGSSGLGSAAHEGTFIGTRRTADHFVYGRDLAYLFTDTAAKVMAGVCGCEVPDDNDYTYDAHIGYWHGGDLHYTLVQGGREKEADDTWFYEELEKGILSVMDSAFSEGEKYEIDHYAPGPSGRPARGYLVSVPQIDVTAGGRVYTDVAKLTVIGDSAYDRPISKEKRGAVAAGHVVSVTTAPRNTDEGKFQLVGSGFHPDRTHHSVTFTDQGGRQSTSYVNGGTYTFVMPRCNTEVAAAYEKVASSVAVAPKEYRFKVIQTRTGDRKCPDLTTEVTDGDGKLLTSYAGKDALGAQGTEIVVSATVDRNNEVADSRVKWSLDDTDLFHLLPNGDEDSAGYTDKSASVLLNMDARFFTDVVQKLEKEQAAGGYRRQIPDTIYGAGYQNGGVAVLTASTRPDASYEQKASTDSCRFQVTFQILDHTYVAQEDVTLDRPALEFTVTRRLTGDRKSPSESILVSQPQSLTATFTPDYFSKGEVRWQSNDTGIAAVNSDPGQAGDDKSYRFARVEAVKDTKWIQDLIKADQVVHENDPYARLDGCGQRKTAITVTGRDALGNWKTASCEVTVVFRTDDQTQVLPEELLLDRQELSFDLAFQKAGDRNSEIIESSGFEPVTLRAAVRPELEDTDLHRPYSREITWRSSDPSAVTVDEHGLVAPVKDAKWIQEASERPPFAADHEVIITASTREGEHTAQCRVCLHFQATCIEIGQKGERMQILLTAAGPRRSPAYTWAGEETKRISAAIYPPGEIRWSSSEPDMLSATPGGEVRWNRESAWVQEVMKERQPGRFVKEITVTASDEDGRMVDSCQVEVELLFADHTYSSSGGSGGGGGTGNTGSTAGNVFFGPAAGGPVMAGPLGGASGIWIHEKDGRWTFTGNDRKYADEWGFIRNPYAGNGQNGSDWFRFDETGRMMTGWFQDQDGHQYFLNPFSDNTLGRMMTGWVLLDGKWYYFMPESTKGVPMGALAKDCLTPDGYRVDQDGVWISR